MLKWNTYISLVERGGAMIESLKVAGQEEKLGQWRWCTKDATFMVDYCQLPCHLRSTWVLAGDAPQFSWVDAVSTYAFIFLSFKYKWRPSPSSKEVKNKTKKRTVVLGNGRKGKATIRIGNYFFPLWSLIVDTVYQFDCTSKAKNTHEMINPFKLKKSL